MYRQRKVAMGMAVAAFAVVGMAEAPGRERGNRCASTPAAAIEAARAGAGVASTAPPHAQDAGFRVESVRWDATQRQAWAIIRSCDHAERPALARLTDLRPGDASGLVASAAPLTVAVVQTGGARTLVHAGEVVRLWRADVQAHIELVATAEQNAGLGAKVRLRLATVNDPDGPYAPPKYIAGIVRGPADVEMDQ